MFARGEFQQKWMWHHEPLKLALAVGCKFPIHTKLHMLPTLLVCWSTPGAQTIHRPLGFAYPSPPFQLSRSGCSRNDSFPPTHPIFLPKEKSTERRHGFFSSLILAQRLGTVRGEYVQLHPGAGECPKVLQCSTCRATLYSRLGMEFTQS